MRLRAWGQPNADQRARLPSVAQSRSFGETARQMPCRIDPVKGHIT
jgi:hypothetical protein